MSAFIALSAILAYLLLRERGRRLAAIAAAQEEYHVALNFIAEECCEMPHEFAAIFMAGNSIAMEKKFPGYSEYRAACLRNRQGTEE